MSPKAGAIPILVQHLNHDLGRVRVEAARALWSLAQNNMETWCRENVRKMCGKVVENAGKMWENDRKCRENVGQ